MATNFLLPLLVTLVAMVTNTNAHGRLRQPPSRSSLWRDSRFDHLNPPKNYNDMSGFCGGKNVSECLFYYRLHKCMLSNLNLYFVPFLRYLIYMAFIK